ncbi:hypothetical protein [Methylomonas sp. HYX-M1]|uniref:hypothetical protein n=1 Tax=Methylomonas sp. HYX-M1 TaxID=3139307 RepID=UPI00345BAAC5
MIRIVLVLLLLGQSMSAHAVAVIWKSGRSILVRTPSGIVAKPGLATLLQNVPDYVGGAISKATNPISVAGKTVTANVSRAITPANLSKAVGVAGRMNPAVSAATLAILGISYALDPETQLPAEEVPGDTKPQTVDEKTPDSYVDVQYPPRQQCGGKRYYDSISEAAAAATCDCQAAYNTTDCNITELVVSPSLSTRYAFKGYFRGSVTYWFTTTMLIEDCSDFPGYHWDSASHTCKSNPHCPDGYTYSSDVNQCVGPNQWEPIPSDEIAQDAQQKLSQDPAKAVPLLEHLLEHDIEPESEDTIADDPLPDSIRGDRTVKHANGTDPATGDPTTTTETTEKTIEFQKADANKVINITENTTVTTTTVNNVTNNVINNNVVNNVVNGSGDPVGDGGTDTDTDNGTEQQPIEWGNFSGQSPGDGVADGKATIKDALSTACGGDCTNGPAETISDRITAFKTKYALSMGASGECPALIADLSDQGYGNHNVTGHCDLIENNRGAIATIFNILIAIAFLLIIWSA